MYKVLNMLIVKKYLILFNTVKLEKKCKKVKETVETPFNYVMSIETA